MRKHASGTEIDKDKNQDNHFHSSNMNAPEQPLTPLKVVNETLDDTIIINGNRPEADYNNCNLLFKTSKFHSGFMNA